MKRSTRALVCGLRVSRWWAGILLVLSLAGGCKPRDLVCETKAVFQVSSPEQGTGTAPFSIERLGPEVKLGMLHDLPEFITLKGDNHAETEWVHLGHIAGSSELIFSPAEGLARNIRNPNDVYPMRRFPDSSTERLRFGFRSRTCRDPKAWGASFCVFGEEELYLIADMTCHRE